MTGEIVRRQRRWDPDGWQDGGFLYHTTWDAEGSQTRR
jgi:hypothetical protein